MYAKTESEVSIQNKMGEVSEKQNLERLQKVTLSVNNPNNIIKYFAEQRLSE